MLQEFLYLRDRIALVGAVFVAENFAVGGNDYHLDCGGAGVNAVISVALVCIGVYAFY